MQEVGYDQDWYNKQMPYMTAMGFEKINLRYPIRY